MQENKKKKPFLKAGLGLLAAGLIGLIGFIVTGGSIVFLRSFLLLGLGGSAGVYAGVKAVEVIANAVKGKNEKSNTEENEELQKVLVNVPVEEKKQEEVVVKEATRSLPSPKNTTTKSR